MRLFVPCERENIKNTIIEELKKINGIIAIILVGSGSVGFTDDLSDLDFSIVIDKHCEISAVMKSVQDCICSKWKLLNVQEMQERGLQVYMLDNFLEIDIGYITFENISALRERWLVVYDTTDKVDGIMKQTWQVNKNNHGKKEKVDVEQVYFDAVNDVWHFLVHAIAAAKRENYWRAIGEMDIARNVLIELLGYKYSLETKRFRYVDKFPESIKNTLHKTIPQGFNLIEFKNSIYALIDAVYDELESFYTNSSKINVTRKDVKEYCYDVLESQ